MRYGNFGEWSSSEKRPNKQDRLYVCNTSARNNDITQNSSSDTESLSTIEVHPEFSEASHWRSSAPHPKLTSAKRELDPEE